MLVLYVAGRWPWPVQVGRQRMIDQTLRLAAEMADVHVLAFGEQGKTPDFIKSATAIRGSSAPEAALNVAANPLRPLQTQLFNSASARRELNAAITRLQPDVVVIDMARLAPLAEAVKRRNPNIRLVLDMDDLLSVRYARMLKNGKLVHVAGTFERKLPAPVRALARSAPQALVRVERPLMARMETHAYRLFDAILMVSPSEAEELNRINGGDKAVGFPPVIEQRPPAPHDHSASLRFVFVGAADYAPNAEALALLDRVAGQLKAKLPAPPVPFRFEAAGSPNASLALPNLDVKGFVDDLGEFLCGDAVLVAPILTGTGIKTKIVDALEYATPIVTTDVGAEGLPLEAGKHFIRIAGEDDLVDALERLVTDNAARVALAPMGKAALDRAYATASHEKLSATLKRALGAG